MNRILKPIQTAFIIMILAALSSCTLGTFGQAAEPTATAIDVNAVMTSAAATAFVELTKIAGQASSTPAPSKTPAVTQSPAQVTDTPDASAAATNTPNAVELVATATQDPALVFTPTTETGNATPAGTTAVPSLTPIGLAVPTTSGPTCYNSTFVADVTIPDGTVLKPYEKFYKIWRIQNTGICAWDQGFGLIQWTGPDMGSTSTYYSNHDQRVEPGGIVDIGVELRAPVQPGEYVAHWSMIDDAGKTFGGDFTVFIKVVE